VFGWALDTAQPAIPPKITLHVNDRPVAETLPVYYRPDVGQHCFYFDLTQCSLSETPATVEARFFDGRPLSNSPLIIKAPPRARLQPSETVLFMHIAKTAGTAFRDTLLENYRQSELAYIYPDPPGFLTGDLGLLPLEQRARIRLAIGHFQYGLHGFFPQPCTYVTIVRNPVSRVISHYHYRYRQPNAAADQNPGLALIELLEKSPSVNLDNLMVRCFSGVNERDVPPGHVDREVYDLAVHQLRTSFSFVGHQERSNEAYAVLQQRFGWKQCSSLPEINRTASLNYDQYQSSRAAIEYFNRWDCRLYAEICKLFPLPARAAQPS
jgi:Galactose-3-O-sulfotransferase